MEVACDRHLGPSKHVGVAFQVCVRSRNVATHGILTEAKQTPAAAEAIQQVLLEAADKVQAILEVMELPQIQA